MGSKSDWPTMKSATEMLEKLGVPYEVKVISAHRTPDLMFAYAETAQARGLEVIIAGAGGSAHLPGMVASKTIVPVLGVPIQSKALSGQDSLLSIVQMPKSIPVATVGINNSYNAAMLAVQIFAVKYPAMKEKLIQFRKEMKENFLKDNGEIVEL